MILAADEVERALATLRAGATITVGASRCHSTYGFDNGGWYREDFDEGARDHRAIDEAEIRQLAVERPLAVQPLLRELVWREFQAAFATPGDAARARHLLSRWRDYGGDAGQATILSAVLDEPSTPPSPEIQAQIRSRVRDRVAFRLVMDTIGWDLDPVVAQRRIELTDRLLTMSGDDSAEARDLRTRMHALAAAPTDTQ